MDRISLLHKLASQEYDVLVIGGGITGAGVLLDAQTRGLSAVMVEMNDFASGTSSKSTKLIHGGLRYLKQLEFRLVTEVGRERSMLHKLAPHLVHPDKMLLPIVTGGTYGKLITSVGLTIYDLLAGVKSEDRRKMLSLSETIEAEPLLRRDILEGGGVYAEYRTDDARLVISVIKTAKEYGAVAANYCEVLSLLYRNSEVIGARVKDKFSCEEFEIRARCVINAAGPWSDALRKMDDSSHPENLYLSKGAHIVVHHDRFPIRQTVYFDNEDGRMVFAIPRDQIVYIGTTDTKFEGQIDKVKLLQEDVDYLIRAVQWMFPKVKLVQEDVLSGWAGIRPLIYNNSKTSGEISRKDELFVESSRLITITGGKLTGYRKMAERTIDMAVSLCGLEASECVTDTTMISGNDFDNYQQVKDLVDWIRDKLLATTIDPTLAEMLVHQYGAEVIKIMATFESTSMELIDLIRAEIDYCTENEMVIRAEDYLARRSGWLLYRPWQMEPMLDDVLAHMASKMQWSVNRIEEERQQVLAAMSFM